MKPSEPREATLVREALQRPAGPERQGFLDQVCAGDQVLRQRLETLIRAESVPDLSATPSEKATMQVNLPEEEALGAWIGRYKLSQKIGEGGCGVVFMADQEEPVRRRVAIKVIKLGMDTRQVIARFEAERQALALMDHPNIAKVLDAGATTSGRPYFVMELVKGERITEYCDKNKLATRQRLDLFIQICQAIQHAHQKGIIHRDIKPSNILVAMQDGAPVPKVIDFGIAKATEQRLTEKTLVTSLGDFIGTPAYMSPEQAEPTGLDIDTRTDIYSLGVLLYELLTGQTPFDPQQLLARGIEAMRRAIREEEPRRPSTRLTTLSEQDLTTTARRRQTDAPKLVHLVRGDLDWIVMKCLEKDRTRRYDTANGLAMDLKRHLENQPVIARPPSTAYRLQKAWRRHKTAFAAAALMALVLLAATGISAWLAVRARRAESLSNQRLAESEAISEFLTEVFQSPDPERVGRNITVAETLGTATRKLDAELASQPARRAKLQSTLARTYFALGLYPDAIELQEKVRNYYHSVFGPEHHDTVVAMNSLANFYDAGGRQVDALKLREQVVALRRKVSGPESPDTLTAMQNLTVSYDQAGRHDEALQLREQVLALRRKVSGPEHIETLKAMNNLAISYDLAGRKDEALQLREQVLSLRRKVLGPEHPDTLTAINNLANSYSKAGRRDEALKLREEVLALRRKVSGPEHRDTLMAMHNLANSYEDTGRKDEALKLREQVVALCRKALGPEHPSTLLAMGSLAGSYELAGRREESRKLFEEVLSIRRKLLGPQHPATLDAMGDLALENDLAGLHDEALKMREELLSLLRKVRGPMHRDTLKAMENLAFSYAETGRGSEALALEGNVCELDPKNTDASLTLATLQTWFGRDADYEASRRRLVQQAQGTDQAGTAERAAKAACLRASDDTVLLTNALNLAQRAMELGKASSSLPYYQLGLGLARYRTGQFAAAEQSIVVAEQTLGDQDEIQGIAHMFHAMASFRQNRAEEARNLFTQAEAQMPPLPKDANKPCAEGRVFNHDLLIWWLSYQEARSVVTR